MSLDDGADGDIGYLYYSNLQSKITRDLPVLEEKVKFSEFKGLQMIGKPLS